VPVEGKSTRSEGAKGATLALSPPCSAPMIKECPMCGDRMRLETRETVTRVPGTSQETRTVVREWVCRECDYFEEAEESASE
jgi:C4-type Zn-finger protein